MEQRVKDYRPTLQVVSIQIPNEQHITNIVVQLTKCRNSHIIHNFTQALNLKKLRPS